MTNILYVILTLLKAIAIIYAGIFVARNIWPAFKNDDRKQLRKIGMLILYTFLFVVVLTGIELAIAFSK
jgi:Na+/proline symporter